MKKYNIDKSWHKLNVIWTSDIGKWPTSFPNNMQVSNMQSFDRSKK